MHIAGIETSYESLVAAIFFIDPKVAPPSVDFRTLISRDVVSGQAILSCPTKEIVIWPGSTWTVEAASGIPRLIKDEK